MVLFSDLPVELLLQILFILPIQDIHTLQLVNKLFSDLVTTNEVAIYYHASLLYGFLLRPSSLEKAVCDTPWMRGAQSWKHFFCNHIEMESHWHGCNIPNASGLKIGRILSAGASVHRFEIDELEGTVISTSSLGGLTVTTVDSDELLWSLPTSYVPGFALIDWSNGFLIVHTPGNLFEVWRRSLDAFDPKKYLPCSPTPRQLAAVSLHPPSSPPTSRAYLDIGKPVGARRGIYIPVGVLHSPSDSWASRMVYPDFLVASATVDKAFIWDIPSFQLVEIIEIKPYHYPEDNRPHLRYVDISKDYVFVSWDQAVILYPRRASPEITDNNITLYYTGAFVPQDLSLIPGKVMYNSRVSGIVGAWATPRSMRSFSNQTAVQTRRFGPYRDSTKLRAPERAMWFSGAHVSPDGKDLAAVTSHPVQILYVKDFARRDHGDLATSPQSFQAHIAEGGAVYLAFDGKRIVVGVEGASEATQGDAYTSGLYVISVQDLRRPGNDRALQLYDSSGTPNTTTMVLESFQSYMRNTRSIELSSSRIWMTYSAEDSAQRYWPNEIFGKLCVTYVDMDRVEELTG